MLLNLHDNLKRFLNPGFTAKHVPIPVPLWNSTSSEDFLSHSLFIKSFEITLAYLLLRSWSRPVLTCFHVPVFLGAYFAFFSRSVCGCSRSWLAMAAGVRMLCCSSPWSTGPRASRSAGWAHPCAAAGAGGEAGTFWPDRARWSVLLPARAVAWAGAWWGSVSMQKGSSETASRM